MNPPRMTEPISIDIQEVEKNLCTIDYRPPIRGSNRFPMALRKHFHRHLANRIIECINGSIDITWSFDPSSFQYLGAFGARLNIFHPVDIHRSTFEKATAKYADVILATSDRILGRYKSVDKPKFKINHGLADHFLSSNRNHNDLIKRPDRINVGYVGNLHYQYLDTTALKEIIILNPDVDFYFIGPYKESNIGNKQLNSGFIESLKALTNTYLVGEVASEDLPGYLRDFDLFLMCYTGDRNIAEMANPHKILEFLSTGRVVVSHYIDEYRNQDHIICMGKRNSELPKLFSDVISKLDYYNDKNKSKERISLARNNTYDRQLNRIELILENHL